MQVIATLKQILKEMPRKRQWVPLFEVQSAIRQLAEAELQIKATIKFVAFFVLKLARNDRAGV